MTKTSQCGDRRCTLESAEMQVRSYREGYTVHVERLRKSDVDNLHPSLTRVKTEIDELEEAIERAKKQGAAAWEGMKDSIQIALDRLASNYRESIGHRTK
jgi:hypothetical protein